MKIKGREVKLESTVKLIYKTYTSKSYTLSRLDCKIVSEPPGRL